ncbi:MAG TPA: serine hydrolase domain-containing protein [Steroidobacteraceae bacterium]
MSLRRLLQLAGLAWLSMSVLMSTSVDAQPASVVQGDFSGTLGPLRLVLHIAAAADGTMSGALDSLDQGAMGIPCSNFRLEGEQLSFDVPSVGGRWSGSIQNAGATLSGTWTQRTPTPLTFTRGTPSPAPAVTFLPAMEPVDAQGMKAVLDRDFAQALKSGKLAPQTGAGITIGVLRKGTRSVFSYGTATPEAIFEIGSVTKTFTGLLLAQMIEQGKARLDQPVRELLPAGTISKPNGPEISLLDLVTQHSGLPRMPDNFHPADPANPYADYHAANLYQYIAQHGVAKPADAPFLYSNLGFGLLGQALANRAGRSYAQLLEEEIAKPLGLEDTVVVLTPQQQSRFIQGHSGDYQEVGPWDLDSLAGAGAIRSTAGDMLTYLEANLHPEKLASGRSPSPSARTLPDAIRLSHELRNTALPAMHVAFAWLQVDSNGSYWHNGATGGYSCFVFFHPREDYAAVVLVNRTIAPQGSLADLIGQHIGQRLAGRPAISLDATN